MARKKSRQPKARPSIPTTSKPPAGVPPQSLAPTESGSNGTHAETAWAIQEGAPGNISAAGEPYPEANGAGHSASTAIKAGPGNKGNPMAAIPPGEPDPDWVIVSKKIANALGALQLAVVLLTLFASVVFLGTLMEHWYSTKIAQELVYRAWWFNLLLLMLTTTIFFAAAKKMKINKEPLRVPPITATTFTGKFCGLCHQVWTVMAHFWPWKRHQFGFIVTHIGLITMLTGGLVNNFFGTDAVMQLVDTQDPTVMPKINKQFGTVHQSDNASYYPDLAELSVREEGNPHGFGTAQAKTKTWSNYFWGGPFPWNARPSKEAPKTDTLLSVMAFLHNPLGNSWSMNMDNGLRLEVLDYIPLAKAQPFTEGDDGYPAFLLQLRTDKFPEPFEEWMSLNWLDPDFRQISLGPALVESLGRIKTSLIKEEFLAPPDFKDLGKRGVLAVHVGTNKQRISVDDNWKKQVKLPGGWSVQINRFLDDYEAVNKDLKVWVRYYGPALEVTLSDPNGEKTELLILARRPDKIFNLTDETPVDPHQIGHPAFFFHSPEWDHGDSQVSGILHFIQGTDGTLYYRSFTRPKDSKDFALEKSGEADVENQQEFPVWQKMGWAFRIVEYYPYARRIDDYAPVNIAPGKETDMERERYRTMIYCRLSGPNTEPTEFWLKKGQGKKVTLGEHPSQRTFIVRYDYKVQPLGFTLKLERAEMTKDPGTGSPATYSSFVQIFDPELGIHGEHRLITMNEPLEHRGLTFYQSQMQFTGEYDSSHRPVSFSGFTVASDPGLGLKYIGSIMLGLGIAIMFYMKAYFFKPRRRQVAADTPSA